LKTSSVCIVIDAKLLTFRQYSRNVISSSTQNCPIRQSNRGGFFYQITCTG